jgi:hypothetical protein
MNFSDILIKQHRKVKEIKSNRYNKTKDHDSMSTVLVSNTSMVQALKKIICTWSEPMQVVDLVSQSDQASHANYYISYVNNNFH